MKQKVMLKFCIYYIDNITFEIANNIYNIIKKNSKVFYEHNKVLHTPLFTFYLKELTPYCRALDPDVIICPEENLLTKEQFSIIKCNMLHRQNVLIKCYNLKDDVKLWEKL